MADDIILQWVDGVPGEVRAPSKWATVIAQLKSHPGRPALVYMGEDPQEAKKQRNSLYMYAKQHDPKVRVFMRGNNLYAVHEEMRDLR